MRHVGLMACVSLVCATSLSFGQVIITEIMYDPSGSDTGREWIEIQNTSTSAIDLTSWKFFEANVNHGISEVAGYTTLLQPNGFAVIVSDKEKFLIDFPSFSGALVKSSFSLNNTGELLAMKNNEGVITDQYTYDVSIGANGDGNSLQKNGASWLAALANPGLTSGGGSTGGSDPGTGATSTTATSTTQATSTPPSQGGGSQGTSTSSNQTAPSNAPIVTGSGGVYVVPQLFGAMIVPQVTLAGVAATFSGQAFTFGGKQVPNPRFAWNFGDGNISHGATTTHTYRYPGTYHIALDVTATFNNNETSVLEHGSVQVIAPDVGIFEGKDGEGFLYTQIDNNTKYTVDISSWIIRRGNSSDEHYVLPKNTFIAPFTSIRIGQDVTHFKNDNVLKKVELLFPNQKKVAEYDPLLGSNEAEMSVPDQAETVPVSVPAMKAVTNSSLRSVAIATSSLQASAPPSSVATSTPETVETALPTSTPQTEQAASVGAVSSDDTRSIVWFLLPLAVLLVGSALVLTRKEKESSVLEDYTIIEDGK